MNDLGVNKIGENGESALEVGEEGRVVEGPGAGLVGVPLREREGVGESEPVAVNLEICAMVGGDEEKLYAGGYPEEP